MSVTYNKLWHILIDRGMRKKEMQEAAGLTNHTMLKLRNNENITTEIIGKICRALACQMDDIMEFVEE
jgi:DNA-binding Xre family transcriptional regulator